MTPTTALFNQKHFNVILLVFYFHFITSRPNALLDGHQDPGEAVAAATACVNDCWGVVRAFLD